MADTNAWKTDLPLDYLRGMTDDVGIVQHAVYSIARRQEGYATDDNARALVVVARRYHRRRSSALHDLINTYVAFLHHSIGEDGLFKTFMAYDRRWLDMPLSGDTHGRCLWAAAEVVNSRLPDPIRLLAGEIFERAVCRLDDLDCARGRALALIGLDAVINVDQRQDYLDKVRALADTLIGLYERCATDDWRWFEDAMTYCNARLPHALLCAYRVLKDDRCLQVAEESLRFLNEMTTRDGLFVPIGTEGWADRHGNRALYDQQPVEAGTTVEAATLAHAITGHDDYADMAARAYGWFHGLNTFGQPIADPEDGSCCDGLHADAVNMNRGAESTVSYLIAAQCLAEMTGAAPEALDEP